MLLDCEKLINWKMSNILQQLQDQKASYMEIMTLKNESKNIKELPRTYNHLDEYTDETKIIHMTGRLTQPWKTGLPIDFTINKAKKILGVIPREPILTLLGKRPSHYQKHPNQKIENLFFDLAREALKDGAITKEFIEEQVTKGNVRKDILQCLENKES